jgi:MFS transporter, ACS family, glucarate transporter
MTALDRQDEPVAPASAARTGRLRYTVLAMLFAVTTVNYADRSTISIAGDAMQKQLGIGSVTMGYIFSAFSWSYLVAQIPGGWLLDRFGSKKIYGAAIFIWSVFTMAQGGVGFFSAGAAVVVLFLLRFLVGFAEAPSFPGNSRIVAAWFPTRERGTASAFFNSAQYFATVVFAPLMGWLVVGLGWEHVFTVIGGLGVVLAVLWTKVIHSPLEHPRVTEAEMRHLRAGGALVDMDRPAPGDTDRTSLGGRADGSPGTDHASLGASLRRLRRLLANRTMLGVFVGQYFINTITWFFLTWFPVYLVQDRGMSILNVGLVASLPALCGFIGGILGGYVSDRLTRRGGSLTAARKTPIVVGLLLSTTIVICNYVSASWLVVAIMALSFFGKGLGALGWAVMSDIAPKQITGLSGSLFNAFGALAGIVTPIVIGYLIDSTGSFNLALVFVGACAALAAVSYLVIVPDIRRLELADLAPGGRDAAGTAAA